LEAARATLPERVWMQEFMALFLEEMEATEKEEGLAEIQKGE